MRLPSFLRHGEEQERREALRARLGQQLYLAQEAPTGDVDLSACGLTAIPDGLLPVLKVSRKDTLILSDNELHSLSERNEAAAAACANLSLVRHLDLARNRFKRIPTEINMCAALVHLDLSSNLLRELPETLFSLSNLEVLLLSGNKLTHLSPSIARLERLRRLDIKGNGITVLPSAIGRLCGSLEALDLDPDKMNYPVPAVCAGGTEAILRAICSDTGQPYEDRMVAAKAINGELRRSTDDAMKEKLRRDADWIGDMVRRLEEERAAKRRVQLETERQLNQDAEQHAAAFVNSAMWNRFAAHSRNRLIDEIAAQQMHLDRAIRLTQEKAYADQRRTLKNVQEVEERSSQLIAELLEYNEKAKAAEQLMEKEERRRLEEDNLLKVHQSDLESLRRKDMEKALSHLLAEQYSAGELLQMRARLSGRLAAAARADIARTDQLTSQRINLRDADNKALLQDLVNNEKVQQELLANLLFSQDARTIRLKWQIDLIQAQLTQVSQVERQKRDARATDAAQFASAERAELTRLMLSLIKEREKRAYELKKRLQEMEVESANMAADYWLVQLKRLLDSKPDVLIQKEVKMEANLTSLLHAAGASMFIPMFAREHITTMSQLADMTEDDLERIGVNQAGVRWNIRHLVEKYGPAPSRKFVFPDGDKKKAGEPNGLEVPEQHPEPSCPPSPQIIRLRYEMECSVCMNAPCNLVLVPCGHVCTCATCGSGVTHCPLCRTLIDQRVDLTTDVSHPVPSAPIAL